MPHDLSVPCYFGIPLAGKVSLPTTASVVGLSIVGQVEVLQTDTNGFLGEDHDNNCCHNLRPQTVLFFFFVICSLAPQPLPYDPASLSFRFFCLPPRGPISQRHGGSDDQGGDGGVPIGNRHCQGGQANRVFGLVNGWIGCGNWW